MKNTLRAAVVFAFALPFALGAQEGTELKEFRRTLILAPGLQVSLVHVNEKTLPVLFQPPTIYAMRARAREGTLLFVQGTTDREVEIDPARFALDQNGESTSGKTLNIKNFQKGKISGEQRVDGVIEFATRVDLTKPFKIKYGRETAEFAFNAAQVKAMMPAPVPQD